ncbi:MAG: flavodoxin domain-containing protein [Proteobacteria bacterium]|nr:flavodoxin domain-containing protein [Pseudomonadota bacterium]
MHRPAREYINNGYLFKIVITLLLVFGCFFALCPNTLAAPRTPADLIEDSCGGSVSGEKRILVSYDTIHGSTAEVAKSIGAALCSRGFQVDIRFVSNVTSLADYDAVILGSAIYEFRWLPDAAAFLKKNQAALSSLPVAYFIVCSALFQDTPENRDAVKKSFIDPVLTEYPDIKPLSIGLFGGAVDFKKEQYNLFEKIVLRILGLIAGFKDSADWRNWDYINSWANEVGDQLQ